MTSWFRSSVPIWLFWVGAAEGQPAAAPTGLPKPVRVAAHPKVERVFPGTSHSHPGICVTRNGTVVIVHYVENAGQVLISRSTDHGNTWSPSTPIRGVKCKCYPGALTALGDGRILVTWNCWDKDLTTRCPHFSLSNDDGKSWSEPKGLPLADPTSRSRVRHSILELTAKEWLFPLEDRTVLYHDETGKVTPFGDGSRRGYGEPVVRTVKGTLLTGQGLRSTDAGKTWQQVKPFPRCGNYHNDLLALSGGLVVATEASKGMTHMRLVVSRDDGRTWDVDRSYTFYDPGRRYGNGSPHLAQLDKDTLGVVFLDDDRTQSGGPGVFFLRLPLEKLRVGGQ